MSVENSDGGGVSVSGTKRSTMKLFFYTIILRRAIPVDTWYTIYYNLKTGIGKYLFSSFHLLGGTAGFRLLLGTGGAFAVHDCTNTSGIDKGNSTIIFLPSKTIK